MQSTEGTPVREATIHASLEPLYSYGLCESLRILVRTVYHTTVREGNALDKLKLHTELTGIVSIAISNVMMRLCKSCLVDVYALLPAVYDKNR